MTGLGEEMQPIGTFEPRDAKRLIGILEALEIPFELQADDSAWSNPNRSVQLYLGIYIYYVWPSKYDLVFWPLTDENWICLNPQNGYAAFNDDFEKLSDAEKPALKQWLKENYRPGQRPKSHQEKLAWLERVYSQRRLDDEFWCRFYRLMAYVHAEDTKMSLAYVRRAVALLERKLASNPEGVAKLEVLYLLGEYHRRLGDSKKAQEFFGQVKDVKYKDDDGKEQTGHPYFARLVEDRLKLMRDKASKKPESGDGK